MKTRVLRSLLVMVMAFIAFPIFAQDWMEIHFKDGTYRKFFMKNVIEMVASNIDAEGVQHDNYEYQRVVTDYDVFTYLISNVDSIAFTKYDEETARHNYIEATNGVFIVLRNNPTLTDVLEHIDEIKNAEGVEDAWSDGHELFVKIKGFGIVPFHFSHRDNAGDDESNLLNIKSMKAMIPPS
ncbi:MAG: hypothetical protein J5867_07470, partial [Prevotella sp.]|nr:hypothetical protein [Prevotella sp.]